MILRQVQDRIVRMERHYRAADAAVAHFYAVCLSDPTHIDIRGLRVRDIRDCALDIEDTYLVRAYAEFEMTLRDFWETIRRTRTQARQLIDGVAVRCSAYAGELMDVHTVREYRNWLVHGGPKPQKVTLLQGQVYLCKFLRHLPPTW